MEKRFSAIITKEKLAYVAFCPELGVVSQGKTEKKALGNLKEAVELYLEDPDVLKLVSGIKQAKLFPLKINA